MKIKISAEGISFKELNELIRNHLSNGAKEIELYKVNGLRYIGSGLRCKDVTIKIYGTPGNDLGFVMDGLTIDVFGNTQDGVGNTMNNGKIIIHGDARDVLGYSMRGGKIFVKGSVGYRAGIHMKEYKENFPVIIIGNSVKDYCGEYMAGGKIIVLGLSGKQLNGKYLGTGMHGGSIYLRADSTSYDKGERSHTLSNDVNVTTLVEKGRTEDELKLLRLEKKQLIEYLTEFCQHFSFSLEDIIKNNFENFIKLVPLKTRPYKELYAI